MADNDKKQEMSTNSSSSTSINMSSNSPLFKSDGVDPEKQRFPHCIVWTPIPMLTWLFPFIGHMGIATTQGIIRDFAGPYFVSEDCMAFGNPAKYWQLPLNKVPCKNSKDTWDGGVHEASEIYKGRMHNLCCDNCHSHVARALNIMNYDKSSSWNMVKLAFLMLVHGKYVSFGAFLKTWVPFLIMVGIIVTLIVTLHLY